MGPPPAREASNTDDPTRVPLCRCVRRPSLIVQDPQQPVYVVPAQVGYNGQVQAPPPGMVVVASAGASRITTLSGVVKRGMNARFS